MTPLSLSSPPLKHPLTVPGALPPPPLLSSTNFEDFALSPGEIWAFSLLSSGLFLLFDWDVVVGKDLLTVGELADSEEAFFPTSFVRKELCLLPFRQ